MHCDGLPDFIKSHYEIHEWRHACAILQNDFPAQWQDIVDVLTDFRLYRSHVVVGGGGKGPVAKWLDGSLESLGWIEKKFATAIEIDETRLESPTHKVDCVKGHVALEIEWSNKDPFYDRDLNNFRLLFDLRAISVGVIITKSDDLRPIFEGLGIWDKFGTSTTWMHKLLPRVEGGGGGGCPLLVFGITGKLYDGSK